MAGMKKLMAIGLALALTVPTTVYATETTDTTNTTSTTPVTIATKDITNKSGEKVGSIICTTDVVTTTWVKELELTASVVDMNNAVVDTVTYSWTDSFKTEGENESTTGGTTEGGSTNPAEDPTKQATYKVSESGTYIVTIDLTNVTTGWELSEKTIELNVPVENIDSTGPVVSVTKSTEDWTKDEVTVTVECVDNQPDLSESDTTTGGDASTETSEPKPGSGLHAQPYSFDDGQTWTTEKTYKVSENKEISFIVRDTLGNQTKETIKVENIDKTAPTVSLTATDEKNEDGDFVLTATASDAESGLHEFAYLWAEGQEWSKYSSATIPVEGTFSVTVRDKAGNTASASVTIEEKVTDSETESESETTDGGSTDNGTTGGNTTGGSTGSGTTGGSTGSGTTGGSTGSGTTGGSTGSGTTGGNTTGGSTGSGTTGGSSNTGSNSNTSNNTPTGNPDWEDNSYISGVVDVPERETSESETETETETETESETETETETKETKETKESKETKEILPTPVTDEDDGFKFPIGLALIIAAILIVLSIIILVIKMMVDRHAAAVAEEDDDEDMSKVYARVNKEATKTMEAAAATVSTKKAVEKAAEPKTEIKSTVSLDVEDDLDIEAAIGASVAAAIAEEEPVVKKVHRKHVHEPEVTAEPEDEVNIGEFAAAAVAAGIAVVDDEKEMEAAISEMEEEKAAHTAGAAPAAATESVVIEGAHSRLIIDPETGEYKYEFK